MVNQKEYFDLLDWLEDQQMPRPQQFFGRMKAAFGIANLLYVDAAASSNGFRLHRICHTLDCRATQAFVQMGGEQFAPVLKLALSAVKPTDWSALWRKNNSGAALYATWRTLGLPAEGVIYPLVSRGGRSALLAINIDIRARELPRFRRLHDRDINALAVQFHAAVLESEAKEEAPPRDPPRLTRRERETLAWAAAGKSYWEIATILGISERTVRFFMTNARRKLNVVSNTQAVAEAVWHGIIHHG